MFLSNYFKIRQLWVNRQLTFKAGSTWPLRERATPSNLDFVNSVEMKGSTGRRRNRCGRDRVGTAFDLVPRGDTGRGNVHNQNEDAIGSSAIYARCLVPPVAYATAVPVSSPRDVKRLSTGVKKPHHWCQRALFPVELSKHINQPSAR